MAMFATFPSTIMESTTVEPAPEAPAPLLWRRPKAASIIVDGKAANIAIQLTPSHADSAGVVQAWLPYICCFGKCSASMVAILLLFQLCQHGGRTPAVSAGVPPGGG